MEEIDLYNSLSKGDLFELFKQQLKKDFESAGAGVEFINDLPKEYGALKSILIHALQLLMKNSSSALQTLLYRIDISEQQIKNYRVKNGNLDFEDVLAELIIKRVLQKVVFKKKFSS